MQQDTFAAALNAPEVLPLDGADLLFYRDIGLADPASLFDSLLRDTAWQQESVKLFGKSHLQPRLEAWYGDPGAAYSYSGIHHSPRPWNNTLKQLRAHLESLAGTRFNSVLLNHYRDGSDSMGLHADDEPELGPEPVIASLSLGAERRMYFKHKRDRQAGTYSLDLPGGSLLLMRGATQDNWKHGIRKTARACGPRINLTFRTIAL